MILSFSENATEDIYNGINSKRARKILNPSLWDVAIRKLDMINAAEDLNDLRIPPSNHLEMLKDNLKGLHSIRINNQYRIIFCWTDLGARDVAIVDYH